MSERVAIVVGAGLDTARNRPYLPPDPLAHAVAPDAAAEPSSTS